jgi:cytochrome c
MTIALASRTGRIIAVSLVTSLLAAPALADGNVARGKRLALTNCARCHAIDKAGTSPLAAAPPFRTLHKRYPVEDLEEPLAEGISTGHPIMPEFRFEPNQIADFISFLKTLE